MTKIIRKIPEYIEGYGEVIPFGRTVIKREKVKEKELVTKQTSKVSSFEEAIANSGLADGMTVSFHHHLRNGDYVMGLVFKILHKLGIKDLTLSASSISKTHDCLLEYMKNGTITKIYTSGFRSALANEVQHNFNLKAPVVFMTHGGRARGIEEGSISIDVSFVATSCCDALGNMNGKHGKSAFGSIGYPMVDVKYAKKTIAVTDNLVGIMKKDISISKDYIDSVVVVDNIGNPQLIATGSTKMSRNPMDLLIAKKAANVLVSSGYIRENYSFQAGSGGISLSVCRFLKEYMEKNSIIGEFASGGITANLVDMLEAGLFRKLYDVQTFGSDATSSLNRNENHIEMSADTYANPGNEDCIVNKLDVMILSATEIDINFNINSVTGSSGVMMGALGGAPDTASGAKLTMVVAPSMRKRIPIVVEKVRTICTPGENVDLLVTERGVCVNPKRIDLVSILKKNNIVTIPITTLKDNIHKLTGVPNTSKTGDNIVGIIEYRDGSVLDIIYDL